MQVRGGDIVPAVAHVVMLDDDPLLARMMPRAYDRLSFGTLRLAHFADPASFRTYILSLVGGPLPLVFVTSDFNHVGGTNGFEDLSFVRDMPCDLAAGGVQLSAAGLVLQTGYCPGYPEGAGLPSGTSFVPKPFGFHEPFRLLRASVCRLIDGLEAELAAAPHADVLRGPLTWGPAQQVRASLAGLRCFAAMTAEGRRGPWPNKARATPCH